MSLFIDIQTTENETSIKNKIVFEQEFCSNTPFVKALCINESSAHLYFFVHIIFSERPFSL